MQCSRRVIRDVRLTWQRVHAGVARSGDYVAEELIRGRALTIEVDEG